MRFLSAWLPLGRVLAAIDLLLIVWVFAGIRVADEVEGLTSLSDTVVQAGDSIAAAGAALGAATDLPVVGDRYRIPQSGSGRRAPVRLRVAGNRAKTSTT